MKLVALAVIATLATGCQTRKQSVTVAVVGVGVAVIGGAATYTARDDDEGPPIIFPIMLLAGGVTAIVSGIHALALDE